MNSDSSTEALPRAYWLVPCEHGCGRVFDFLDETDSAEWFYGHDCEA